jgi:hypothetical protein
MWKIFHWFFGWHYVIFKYGFSNEIRRVRTAPNGTRFVTCYGNLYEVLPTGRLKALGTNVVHYSGYTPLTWKLKDEDTANQARRHV